MNPSTDDILSAIEAINSDNIFVFPNNKNVIMSAQQAAKLSKKALLRQVGSHNPNPKAAEMEKLLEEGLNSIGLGPGGFGGKLSVMGVNIEQASRHPATLAMGMSTACWAHRRAGIKIKPDFTYDFFTHKGAVL